MKKNIDVVTISDLWKKDNDGYMPVLMEIYNPDIKWESSSYEQDDCYLRLIANDSKVIYKGKTWLPCAFTFSPPETDGQKVGTASVTISALDARVRFLLRTIRISCDVRIVAMFAKMEKDDSSGKFVYKFAPLDSFDFEMQQATATNTTATFSLTFKSSLQQNVPFDLATSDRVPGVVS